ncbi:MAG: hypothetical protein BWZ03_00424 [bacterium ADurb.BinA186]|nr:MAG: hypothetical protein BWZ03_00424 [bacterium ADurb.BinA186]
MNPFKTVDEYINAQPPKQKEILQKIRSLVKSIYPRSQEALGYAVASFKLNGKVLIYYASFKNHIGIYPVPKASGDLMKEIEKYQTGKGTMRFPLDEEMPYEFIEKIIKAREGEIK